MKSQKRPGCHRVIGFPGYGFFLNAKHTDASTTITANPGFQFRIVFKNIYARRVSFANSEITL